MNFLLLFAIGCLVLLPFVLFAKGKLLMITIALSYLWMFSGLLYLMLKLLSLEYGDRTPWHVYGEFTGPYVNEARRKKLCERFGLPYSPAR